MAKAKAKAKVPNLGTLRDSDHNLSPRELPTNGVPGEKPPYQITEGAPAVHSWRESQVKGNSPYQITAEAPAEYSWRESKMHGCGLDTVDRTMYPDPHVLETDIAHSKTPLSSQSRPAVREQYGGGVGETKVSRNKRGGLQTLRDTPASRPENRRSRWY